MPYRIVDVSDVPVGPGPHPAASPFDRRVSDHLGVSAFEIYQVELPPHESTVEHDHLVDRTEDVYVVLAGGGWLVVDDERIPVVPGQFMAVTLEARRHVEAGPDGMTLIALCAEQRD